MSLPRLRRNIVSHLSTHPGIVVPAFHTALARFTTLPSSQILNPSIRQRLVPGFLCERYDQQPNPERDSCVGHRFPDGPNMTNHCTDQKIHTRSNKPSKRSCKRKGCCADRSIVLFR